MSRILVILICIIFISCNSQEHEIKEYVKPVVVHKEKINKTLVDIARDLLKFEKYDMALELVSGDTSYEANNIRARVHEAKGKIRQAIELDIKSLRQYDDQDFFEGNWILCDIYELCLKEIDYSTSLLQSEITQAPSNYQLRLLLMKILWNQGENLEKVIILGDEFRKELPDMSSEVSFNYWRQDALDSLQIKDPVKHKEISTLYKESTYSYIERID